MFRLRFFGGFAPQRRAFLATDQIAPLPVHPAVADQLEGLEEDLDQPAACYRSRHHLMWAALRAVLPLVSLSARWNALAALIVLVGVLASREVVKETTPLHTALVLAAVYLVARVTQSAIELSDWRRRAQINRGVQVFLFRVVNRKVAVLDPTLSGQFSGGQLKTLIGSDVEAVEDFLSAALAQWVPTLVMLSVLGPALYVVMGWLGLLALGLALLSLPIAILGGRLIERFQARAQGEQDSLTTLIGEWVRNIRLVRYLGWQPAIQEEIADQMRRFSWQHALRHTVACVVYGLTWSWWMVPVLGMFVAAELSGGTIDLIGLFSTIWILDHLMNYIQHIPYSLSLYGAACAGADRILELLAAPEISRGLEPPRGALANPDWGAPIALHLREVTMRYGEHEALRDLSLSLDLRSRTAIVGAVGAGKTTLLELLVGECIPSDGSIEVEFEGGQRGSLWRADVYRYTRKFLAYSPQRPFLSNTLMRFNIDLGGERSDAEVREAARRAQLEPDLELLPRGLDEEVGETGINLSGGQKQRVSLARAFVSGRPILLLDDPLSAVDANTEGALMEELLRHARGMVLVSHRLGELLRCDRVVVLGAGRVEEDGVPTALAADPASRFSQFLAAVEHP